MTRSARRERKTVRVPALTMNALRFGEDAAREMAVEQLQVDYENGMLERALRETQRMPVEDLVALIEASR